ncbi:MAG: hypothetical protein LHW51_05275 [Candidatus Cloacimonetes bacterium]|jgi:hypothetical protein|nr:hypothetical protein [Candidatus Cloacimonadota bacterium]
MIQNQRGAALFTVLVLLALMSLVLAGILIFDLSRTKLINNNKDLLQARYNAEAGVYTLLDSLSRFPNLPEGNSSIVLPWGDKCDLSFDYYGGFIRVYSTGYAKRKQLTICVYAGQVMPQGFDSALIWAEDKMPLTFAGNTIINGDIVTGKYGTQIRPFQGTKFTGAINGKIVKMDDPKLPKFSSTVYSRTIRKYNGLLQKKPQYCFSVRNNIFPLEDQVGSPDKEIVLYSDESLSFDESSPRYSKSIIVISRGMISLSGDYEYPENSIFISRNGISVSGTVRGSNGILYSPKYVSIKDKASISAQAIAGDSIVVMNQVRLEYPSVLYLDNRDSMEHNPKMIAVRDSSQVNGSVIYNSISRDTNVANNNHTIEIDRDAVVTGLVFSLNSVVLHGSVYGTVMTQAFFDYYYPVTYSNWLVSSMIDVSKRNKEFLLPLSFETNPLYKVLTYHEVQSTYHSR